MADIKPTVLIVDDEISIRESFSLILEQEFNVIMAASGEAGLKKVIDEKIDLVYLDMRMSGMSGIETLTRIKEIAPDLDVILVTAVNDVANATHAIQLGARDYVVKPFDITDILNRTRTITLKARTKGIKALEKDELLGTGHQMRILRVQISEASKNNSPVILFGERGVEFETTAHTLAYECDKDLKVLDISENTNANDLFGKEQGTFTDEFGRSTGILEEASGGIVLLRNIELLDRDLQIKLKNALKKKEMSREGSFSKIQLSARIIASTSADLKSLVSRDLFDTELIKFLSETIIEIPSLRTRQSDIPFMVEHLLERFNLKYNKTMAIAKITEDILSNYPWPGNTIELENTIESIALTYSGVEVTPEQLPYDILMQSSRDAYRFVTLGHIEGRLEREHILGLLKKNNQNKSRTAVMLGIPLRALEMKLEPTYK